MTALEEDLDHAYRTCGGTPELLAAVDQVLRDHDASPARAVFERAGARDSLGLEAEAVPLYRQALELGLDEPERLQCRVQLGSSLRNVGQAQEAVRVLRQARDQAPPEGRDQVDAFLALALHSSGDPEQALAVALQALAPHLTRYQRAVSSYAVELREVPTAPPRPLPPPHAPPA